MKHLTQIYRWLNLLSIDVVLGAVCGALFFGRLVQVTVLPYGLMALAATVWIIYTVDHLLDARRVAAPATTRHRFHRQHRKVLVTAVVMVALVDLVLVSLIRRPVLWNGLWLGGIVAVYLLISRNIQFTKELVVAIGYTGGVMLPAISVTQQPWPWVIIIQFAAVAFTNLLVFSWFDRDIDQREQSPSFVTALGERITQYAWWILTAMVLLLIPLSTDVWASACLALMQLMTMLLIPLAPVLRPFDRYRLLGEAVFYMPIVYVWSQSVGA